MSKNCSKCGASLAVKSILPMDCIYCGHLTQFSSSYIRDEQSKTGIYTYVCSWFQCARIVAVPNEVWCPECKINLRSDYKCIIREYNRHWPTKIEVPQGACPGCGHEGKGFAVGQEFLCWNCGRACVVSQSNISKSGNTNVMCASCHQTFVIPPNVWCPICGLNLRWQGELLKTISTANPSKWSNERPIIRY